MRLKKLMLLVFLAQYGVEGSTVYEYRCGGRPLARTDFYLWSEGPASDEVYDALEALNPDLVAAELGLEVTWPGPLPQLPQPAAARLAEVLAAYEGWRPWELERHVKKLLGLDIPEKLKDYMGWPLRDYLRAEGYALVSRDLTP